MKSYPKKSMSLSQSKLNRLAESLYTETIEDSLSLSHLSVDDTSFQRIRAKKKDSLEKDTNQVIHILNEDWEVSIGCSGNNIHGQGDVYSSFNDIFTIFTPCYKNDPDSTFRTRHIDKNVVVNEKITKIFCGYNLSTYISSTGQAYSWGISGLVSSSSNHSLSSKLYYSPICVPCISKISCGLHHIACLNNKGQLWTWGIDEYGCLGHGKKGNISSPQLVSSFDGLSVEDVACGGYHTLIIATGEVYSCGQGKGGQLGLGDDTLSTFTPTIIPSFTSFGHRPLRVSCGLHHSLILAANAHSKSSKNALFSFGFGEHGRLGLGDEISRFFPTQIHFSSSEFSPKLIGAGESHSVVCGGSECLSWGNNEMCQLGCGLTAEALEYSNTPVRVALPDYLVVTHLSVGSRHSALISASGVLFTWGWNEEGQCGHNTEKNSSFPRPCKLPRIYGQECKPTDVSCGLTHSVVLLHNKNYCEKVVVRTASTTQDSYIVDYSSICQSICAEVVCDEISIILRYYYEEMKKEVIDLCALQLIDEEIVEISCKAIDDMKYMRLESVNPIPLSHVLYKDRIDLKDILNASLERRRSIDYDDLIYGLEKIDAHNTIDNQATIPLEIHPVIENSKIEIVVERGNTVKEQVQSSPVKRFDVYYKDGQDLDICYVANVAKRAEMKKLKKLNTSMSLDSSENRKLA